MPSIFDVRSSNAGLLTPPTSVAIIVGGASGIGQGIAEAFARYVQGNIIVIGDNSFAAGPMLSKLTKLRDDTDAKHEFIQSDVTLMRNVRAVARQVLTREPKINFLVMAPGTMTARGREETNEGIDKELALHYYSRWMLIRDLLPGLLKAKEAGEDARVLSVLGAGKGGAIDLKDLKMENQKFWSSTSTLKRASTYTDLMIEEFSLRNPGLTFVHAYPGSVRTQAVSPSESDSLFIKAGSRILNKLKTPLTGSASPQDAGEYMLYGLLNARGASRVGSKGEDIGDKNYFGSEKERQDLWMHTEIVASRFDD